MFKTDFLIIGSGIAGLNLALHLAKIGEVCLVTKGKLIHSSSYKAQGGIAAVIDPQDNFEKHIQNTLTAGANHNDFAAVRYLVEHAPAEIIRLESFGVQFNEHSTREGGHDFARIHHTFDQTGKTLVDHLQRQVQAHSQIRILEKIPVLELLINAKKCFGALVLVRKKAEIIRSRATILATGGLTQIYLKTSTPRTTMGDGIALASRAGAELKDLEFVQFHPTALNIHENPYLLISETLRGEGALLRNFAAKEFMSKYHPQKELAPRDIVARAIFQEKKHGPVYLDFRHEPETKLKKRFPFIFKELQKHDFNLAQDLIPITPAAHYTCGGVKVDLAGRTSVSNLYALGETACTGVHGANRLASNSLMEAMVFARPLTAALAKNKNKLAELPPDLDDYVRNFKTQNSKYYPQDHFVQEVIRELMWKKVGIVRTEENLKKALFILESFEKPKDYETKNMLICAILVTRAALARKESLGAHWRRA